MSKFVNFLKFSVVALSLLLATSASAYQTKLTKSCSLLAPDTGSPPKTSARALKPATYKKLERFSTAMQEERYEDAEEIIVNLLGKTLVDFDRAKVATQAVSLYSQLDNWDKVIEMLQLALDQIHVLPYTDAQFIRQQLTSSYMVKEDAVNALKAVKEFFKYEIKPGANEYALYASALMMNEKRPEAICALHIAVGRADKPNKNWYKQLYGLHYQLNDLKGTISILEDFLKFFPESKDEWVTLGQLYFQEEKYMDALAIMELAHEQKYLEKESHYKILGQLYQFLEVPYKAAAILTEGLDAGVIESNEKNWVITAQNWRVSGERDKAIYAYGQASKYSDKGVHNVNQGDLYVRKQDWRKAITALTQALSKGVKREDKVYLQRGIAKYNLGQFDQAIEDMQKAAKDKRSRNQANQWIVYVKERERYQNSL